jgi:hypothetical protein
MRSTAGALNPVVSTPIEASARISPRLKAATMASRSSFGVSPKIVRQVMPWRVNSSATWRACSTPEQKASQDFRLRPCSMISVTAARVIASLSTAAARSRWM